MTRHSKLQPIVLATATVRSSVDHVAPRRLRLGLNALRLTAAWQLWRDLAQASYRR